MTTQQTDLERETSFDKEDSFYQKESTRGNSRKDANFYQKQKEASQTPKPNDIIDDSNDESEPHKPIDAASKGNEDKNNEVKETAKEVIKFVVSNLSLLIILGIYTASGAWMFIVLEQENELTSCYEGKSAEAANVIALKQLLISYIKNNISLSVGDTSKDNQTVAIANIESFLQNFRDEVLTVKGSYAYTGQDCTTGSSVWNFPNVLLFTITIVTTVGYGQITPKTTFGQIVCIIYATVGIPIFLMCCSNVSGIFSKMFRFTYSRICCGICYIKDKKKKDQAKLAERQQKLEEKKNNPAIVVDDPEEEEDEKEKVSVPLTITIFAIGLYIFCGAIMFHSFEGWTLIQAAYFCYITLSTIGFGDLVPGQNTSDPNRVVNLVFGVIYIFFGLAILAMCFDLMQEEIIAKFTWVGSKLGIVSDDDDDEEIEELDKPNETENKKESKMPDDDALEDEKKSAFKEKTNLTPSNRNTRFMDDTDTYREDNEAEPVAKSPLPVMPLPCPKNDTQANSMAEAIRMRQQKKAF